MSLAEDESSTAVVNRIGGGDAGKLDPMGVAETLDFGSGIGGELSNSGGMLSEGD